MNTTFSPSPAVQSLAQQAMAQMKNASYGEARRTGNNCLTQIEAQGNPTEILVAKAAQVAAGRDTLEDVVAVAPEAAALRLLANGVQVPATQAIGQVGDKAVSLVETYDSTQARDLGIDFLYQYLQANPAPAERAVAQAAFAASQQQLTDRNAAIAQQVCLHVLAGGIGGAPGLAIATVAQSTTNQSDRWDDARDMGFIFLQSLADNGDDDRQKSIARTALLASSGHVDAANATNIQLQAYQDILNGAPH